jgi:hypothetical protein
MINIPGDSRKIYGAVRTTRKYCHALGISKIPQKIPRGYRILQEIISFSRNTKELKENIGTSSIPERSRTLYDALERCRYLLIFQSGCRNLYEVIQDSRRLWVQHITESSRYVYVCMKGSRNL